MNDRATDRPLERIYLQGGCSDPDCDCDGPTDATWCSDRINKCDVEYVRTPAQPVHTEAKI
jgi:hypothetical protein